MTVLRSDRTRAWLPGCALLALALALPSAPAATPAAKPAATPDGKPTRAAEKGCKWEKFSNDALRLDAWVERCDFGSRKIDLVVSKNSLAERWSDAKGPPDPLVDVLDLKPGETPEAGIRRLFDERTDKALAPRCVLAPYRDPTHRKVPAGVKRYTFLANAALAKELKAKQDPGDIPEPPCGDWGDTADSIQYWEAQPSSGVPKVLFVRAGQDDPMFDEASLHLR